MSKKEKPALTPEQIRKIKKRRSSLRTTIILLMIMLLGAGIMAYPTVSDWWNSFHASRAIASYTSTVESMDTKAIEAMLAAAREYNARLPLKDNPYRMTEEDLAEYNSLLDLTGTGIMGYIQIQAINVNIPIYHGTEENVLQIAVGHLDWTSLPVGGPGTHAVLSGHRGLPSARLFTDLDKITEGDTFTITVLNQTTAYMVDQIRIVEPAEVSELNIIPGEDYVTLVTCTPYGINTHRMLVRGKRIENVDGAVIMLPPEAVRVPNYLAIPAVAIPLLFVFLAAMLIYYRVRSPKQLSEDMVVELDTEPEKKKKKREK